MRASTLVRWRRLKRYCWNMSTVDSDLMPIRTADANISLWSAVYACYGQSRDIIRSIFTIP